MDSVSYNVLNSKNNYLYIFVVTLPWKFTTLPNPKIFSMELVILMAGIVYGLIIGLIPAAGATTGLITLFGFIPYFVGDPYLGVIFCVAVVASSTTGDSFSGVLLGIPGANSAAATMVDGFPMAKNGEATRALSAAITSSTANGLFWGSLTFLFLPFYTQVVMYMAYLNYGHWCCWHL